jgi:hypothetical protein
MPGSRDSEAEGRPPGWWVLLWRLAVVLAAFGLLSLVGVAWVSYLRGRPVNFLGFELAGAPTGGTEIPPGAVIAFVGETCPEPWQPYRPAAGRFVLGAGSAMNRDADDIELPVLRAGDVGGQAGVALQLPDIPPHSHRLGIGRLEPGRPIALPLPADDALPQFGVAAPFLHKSTLGRAKYDLLDALESAGGLPTRLGGVAARRHDNIPPFVALTYCVFSAEFMLDAASRPGGPGRRRLAQIAR